MSQVIKETASLDITRTNCNAWRHVKVNTLWWLRILFAVFFHLLYQIKTFLWVKCPGLDSGLPQYRVERLAVVKTVCFRSPGVGTRTARRSAMVCYSLLSYSVQSETNHTSPDLNIYFLWFKQHYKKFISKYNYACVFSCMYITIDL
jgi:hypothetical protein